MEPHTGPCNVAKHRKESLSAARSRIRSRTAPQQTCHGGIMKVKFRVRPHARVKRAASVNSGIHTHYLPKGTELPPPWNEHAVEDAETVHMISPVHWAAEEGHVEILKFLLENGACVFQVDFFGMMALHLACKNGHAEAVELLLSHEHPASCCVRTNLLCEILPQIEVTNNFGLTPLHFASLNGHLDVVQVLLSHGAKTHLDSDYFATTPLHMASQNGHVSVIKALLSNGADCNAKSGREGSRGYGYTPLALVLKSQGFCGIQNDMNETEIVRILLQHGANDDGLSVFSPNVLSVLLDYGKYGEWTGWDTMVWIWKKHYCIDNDGGWRAPPYDTEGSGWLSSYLVSRHHLFISDSRHEEERYLDKFEMFFIKVDTAGIRHFMGFSKLLPTDREVPAFSIDWVESLRENLFRQKCEKELQLMKADTIPNTSAAYFDLLTRNLSALSDQQIVGNFDFDVCVRKFPVYGDLTSFSYLEHRSFWLCNQSKAFFYLTEVHLPPECAGMIQAYLSDRDFENMLEICSAVRKARSAAQASQRKRTRKETGIPQKNRTRDDLSPHCD